MIVYQSNCLKVFGIELTELIRSGNLVFAYFTLLSVMPLKPRGFGLPLLCRTHLLALKSALFTYPRPAKVRKVGKHKIWIRGRMTCFVDSELPLKINKY